MKPRLLPLSLVLAALSSGCNSHEHATESHDPDVLSKTAGAYITDTVRPTSQAISGAGDYATVVGCISYGHGGGIMIDIKATASSASSQIVAVRAYADDFDNTVATVPLPDTPPAGTSFGSRSLTSGVTSIAINWYRADASWIQFATKDAWVIVEVDSALGGGATATETYRCSWVNDRVPGAGAFAKTAAVVVP